MIAFASAVVAAALLVVPGLIVGRAFGSPWSWAWAVAPPVSIAAISVATYVAQAVGSVWAPIWVLVVSGVLAIPAWAWSRARPGTGLRLSRGSVVAVTSGTAAGCLILLVVLSFAGARTEAIAQVNDVAFHLNSVRLVLESGVATPTSMSLYPAGAGTIYYPAGWHAVVSAIATWTGASVPVAANMTNLVLAGLVWPAGMGALAVVVFGQERRWAVFATATLAGATAMVPYSMASYGPVYAYFLGVTLVPATMALGLLTARSIRETGRVPWRETALAALAAGGLAAAHPQSLLAATVLLAPFAIRLGREMTQRLPEQKRRLAYAGVVAVLLVVAAQWTVPLLTDAGQVVAAYERTPGQSLPIALASVALMAPLGSVAQWSFSALVLVGGYIAVRQRVLSPVLEGLALLALLYALAAAVDGPITEALTGLWYRDPNRIGALLAVPGILLAALAVDTTRHMIGRHPLRMAKDSDSTANRTAPLAVLAIVVILMVPVLPGRLAAYSDDPEIRQRFWSAAEENFSSVVRESLPPDAVVANDPLDGSPLNYAISGVRVLFPYHKGDFNDDQMRIAHGLRSASTDHRVCDALRRAGVWYAIEGTGGFDDLGHPDADDFEGLNGLMDASGFTAIAGNAEVTLYRIDACS